MDIATQILTSLPKRTERQITFERVVDIERARFPQGVSMTYLAYCQNEVVEIVDDPDQQSIIGLIPQLTRCSVCPSDVEPPVSVMKANPPSSRTMEFDPFECVFLDQKEYTVACADCMQRSYANKQPQIAAE